ncbi:hypothetical protein CWT12_12335 [Actinomyces sp. 432]|uniref:hypothetical protein n=1 Tax=Actinomyces sp. 432 TaxID=2057798 RepID=UPI00137396FE|nr:hypothetical protein [Actinomyces sp. 432]QHO91940.1 hypothetical protein CWT12_12335 [Actinomyces sp. 432]
MTTPARMLTDLAQWLPLLRELEQGRGQPRSPRPNPAHPGDTAGQVPFGIRVDSEDEPADARTAAGIRTWATIWADFFTTWYPGFPQTDKRQTLHKQARIRRYRRRRALTWLATIAPQAEAQHPNEWADFLDELQPIYARVATATGHADATDPDHRCPACGGQLQQAATRRGLTDSRQCTNCQQWYPDGDIIDATRHHTITTTDDADAWVTREEARDLHPTISADLLRQWIHRGEVTSRPKAPDKRDVNLGSLNARVDKHKRDMKKREREAA